MKDQHEQKMDYKESDFSREENGRTCNDETAFSLTDDDCDLPSLEYMEDPYFIKLDSNATPSLDDTLDAAYTPDRDDEEAWAAFQSLEMEKELQGVSIDMQPDAMLCIETEFILDNRKRRLRIFKRKMRDVRVHFQDLSKPYVAKISCHSNYKKFLGLGTQGGDDGTPVSPATEVIPELVGMTPEQIEAQKAEWSQELARVEDEIATLRMVLASKVKLSSELKRKLGISVWKELTDDVNQSLKNVKESQVYQKTESVIKTTAEKTTSILGGLTGGITHKLGQMRNSESFRSIEERVGSAYENVKGKVSSRSNSIHSFTDESRESQRATPVTSPTIEEGKILQ